ncbi:6739_t:CDS:1, partial [Acaulospora morrowiae]
MEDRIYFPNPYLQRSDLFTNIINTTVLISRGGVTHLKLISVFVERNKKEIIATSHSNFKDCITVTIDEGISRSLSGQDCA